MSERTRVNKMNRVQALYFLGRLGVVISVVSMFIMGAMGLVLFEMFATPWDQSYIASFPSAFTHLNSVMSSIPLLRLIISPFMIDLFELGWLLTVVYAMLHLFGASYTLMFRAGLWIAKGCRSPNPLEAVDI